MKTTIYDSTRIGLPEDKKKGLCFSMMKQVGIEKSSTETKSLTHFGSYQIFTPTNTKLKRMKKCRKRMAKKNYIHYFI